MGPDGEEEVLASPPQEAGNWPLNLATGLSRQRRVGGIEINEEFEKQ